MVDDVVIRLKLSIALVEKEKLEEASFDVNVSQQLCEEELSKRVMCTQVDRLAWDHRLSPNPHVLTIYLEFVPFHEAAPERFKECQCEDDNVRFYCRTWILGDGHYH